MTLIITESGSAGHGKDTVADYIIQSKSAKLSKENVYYSSSSSSSYYGVARTTPTTTITTTTTTPTTTTTTVPTITKTTTTPTTTSASKRMPYSYQTMLLQLPTSVSLVEKTVMNGASEKLLQLFYGETDRTDAIALAKHTFRGKPLEFSFFSLVMMGRVYSFLVDPLLVARLYSDQMGIICKRALAMRLKWWAQALIHDVYGLDLPLEDFFDLDKKEMLRPPHRFNNATLTVRAVLQQLGTEVGRRFFGDDVWVELLIRDLDPVLDSSKIIIVVDARWQNEIELLRNYYTSQKDRFLSLKIKRVQTPKKDVSSSVGVNSEEEEQQQQQQQQQQNKMSTPHESEKWIDELKTDVFILNNAGLSELYAQADKVFEQNIRVLLD